MDVMTKSRPAPLKQRDFAMDPMIVIWEATRACALACTHCRATAVPQRDRDELSSVEGMRLIDQVAAFDDPIFVITGGDPLERPDLFSLLEHAVRRGLRTSLAPSVTPRFTVDILDRLREIGVTKVSLSIDAAEEARHDAFRGVPGTFAHTMKLVRAMRDRGMELQINTTVSRQTLDQLDKVGKLVAAIGVAQWSLFFLVPTGRAKSDSVLNQKEFEHVLRWLARFEEKVNFPIKTTEGQPFRRVRIQRKLGGVATNLPVLREFLKHQPQGVRDGSGFIFVSHVGKVYPSGFLPVEVGNVRQQSLIDIYRESPILRALRNPNGFRGKCAPCEFHDVCGGSRARAHAITGDYLESDPSCLYKPLTMRQPVLSDLT